MIEFIRVKVINLFQKHRLLFAIVGEFFIFALVIFLAVSAKYQKSQDLSTPVIIDQAWAKGEITGEERLLYLAYAVFEYDSLPTRFRSNVGWRGTSILEDLEKAANSPSVLCSMSPDVRSEFQRLFNPDTTCE